MSEQDKDALLCANYIDGGGEVETRAAAHIRRLVAEREKDRAVIRQALEALESSEDHLAKPYSTMARIAISALTERVGE